jgi:AcrR family transcriptional regulator
VARPARRPSPTAERILDAALNAFGTRGYEATSLDALAAELGITKQTILYWFGSKEGVLQAVVERVSSELAASIQEAVARRAGGYDAVEAVLVEVFRLGVRQPAVLGVLRELSRLGPVVAGPLVAGIDPLVDRAAAFLAAEMDAGTIRRSDPRLLVLFVYATVVGAATEVEAQRAVGFEPSVASLRRLRRELFAYVRAALQPSPADQARRSR